MNTMTSRTPVKAGSASRSTRRWRLVAIEAAVAVTLLLLLSARLITGQFPRASTGGEVRSIGVIETIVATGVVSLVAWGLLAFLERLTRRAADPQACAG